MSDVVLRANRLSKRYRIGQRPARYRTARETLASAATAPLRWMRAGASTAAREDTVWALEDVSFEVRRGEVVGIIGRNGAGKSTLLKILSRITEPTSGFADVTGRVGALLEVGTGFHLELTGRENIQLSGAILGMTRADIARKFDEIVAFAEVDKFIDTPVKHYSSGMHLRLAFAVAAHLEPDILFVDEVLAVGDLAFQRKCLGKMQDVAQGGRTVLYVSHSLGSIKQLCDSCIVLDHGRVTFRGPTLPALTHYTDSVSSAGEADRRPARGWGRLKVGDGGDTLNVRKPFAIDATFDIDASFRKVRLVFVMDDSSGNCIAHNFIDWRGPHGEGVQPGPYCVRATFPALWLVPDAYTVYLKLAGITDDGRTERRVSDRVVVDVDDSSDQLDGKVRACLIPPVSWTVTEADIRPVGHGTS